MFFEDFSMAEGFGPSDVGNVDSALTYKQVKNEVEEALVNKFGQRAVSRGTKAFDVHENSYRVDADVVACVEHRRYTVKDATGRYHYLSGVQFFSDSGGRVVNWPEQHYENGVAKNNRTNNHFKHLVRIIKRLRYDMEDSRITQATPIPSYLMECLVWNVPDEGFVHSRFTDDIRYVLAHLFNETLSYARCKEWGEINELKYLFRPSQPWTLEEVHAFLDAAWNYVGFE